MVIDLSCFTSVLEPHQIDWSVRWELGTDANLPKGDLSRKELLQSHPG